MNRVVGALVIGASAAVWAGGALGEEDDPRPAKALQDNSFLIEEAYNQEPGVVQHIASLRRQNRNWNFNFTQEWPVFSQAHQFSYSIPYQWVRGDGQRFKGFGDAMLNYRYQFWEEGTVLPAFAPRASLILPTGSYDKGLGNGAWGYQVNLPFSKIIGDRWTFHFNAGLTQQFDVNTRDPVSYNLGASGIYAVTREFNLMLELLGEWNASVNEFQQIEREFVFTVSPGLRYAFNLDAGQLVVGAAAPIGFSRGSSPDYGVLFYLSFEHSFVKKTAAK